MDTNSVVCSVSVTRNLDTLCCVCVCGVRRIPDVDDCPPILIMLVYLRIVAATLFIVGLGTIYIHGVSR